MARSGAPSCRRAPSRARARRWSCATVGDAFGGLDVQRAVAHVNGEIARALIGSAADDQAALDAG